MREERGQILGDVTWAEKVEFWGSISGTLTVADGGKVYMRGVIYGDLVVQDGGRVHVYGNVGSDLIVHEGAKVIHGGTVTGNLINQGGRLFVEQVAKVLGRVKARKGETKFERGSPLAQ